MSTEELKIALILCTCGKSLETYLDFTEIQRHFELNKSITKLFIYEDLCFEKRLNELFKAMEEMNFDRYIIAACTPQILEMIIKNKLKEKKLDVIFEFVNIREHCAWIHKDKTKATNKAILLIEAAIAKIKGANLIRKKQDSIHRHVTIIGGGISGLQVALDLCEFGFEVLLIEKNSWLGGHVVQLETITPFNMTGKELLTTILRKLKGKTIEFKLGTQIKWIDGAFGNFTIHIQRSPPYINENCDLCKKCIEICPVTLPNPLDEGLSTIKAIDMPLNPPFCESIWLNRSKCLPNCSLCEKICPKKAINLTQEVIEETIKTSFIVFSTGYELYHPKNRSVFYSKGKANILNQLQLARMLDPEGPTQGKVIQPSTGKVAKRILMIQCVGSRDISYANYCSKYCCSTAIRHAIEIKKRIPDCEISICYIDIRTPFMDEELYREAREVGIDFIRGKVGNIYYESNFLVTEVVDTLLVKQINYKSDILVLSTALLPSKIPSQIFEIANLKIKDYGFIQEYYPKLKLTETNRVGIYSCGAAMGPKLISECISEAHSVAVSIIKEYPHEVLVRENSISVVNQELCNGCELCIRLCPFGIPKLIDVNEKRVAYIDEKQCKGCGTCISLCPTNAIQLESLQRDQLFAQIKAILADAPKHDEPIILGFICEECAYATLDFAGMLRKSYAENTRFIRLPCVGRLSALDILTAFEYGADMVLIFGCEEGKCHYLEGNLRTKLLVEIMKELLNAIGWEPNRIKMYGLFSADVYKFLDAIEDAMLKSIEFGPSAARLKLKNEFKN